MEILNLTPREIKPKLTFLTGNTWNHQYKNVIVSGNKLKIDGIYGHIEVIDGIAYAVKNAPSKGFYESKSNYESRSEQWMNENSWDDGKSLAPDWRTLRCIAP